MYRVKADCQMTGTNDGGIAYDAEKSTHGRKRAWTVRERHKSAPVNGFPSCFGELADALSQHGIGDLREAGDVRAHHVVTGMAVLRGRRGGVVMDGFHDAT